MNRYLDGDLDDHERMLMMEHLKNCPDDQELFERLQRLSAELEELPKIAPPFSLVDGILPQLAEIDALREAKAAQAAIGGLGTDSEEAASEESAGLASRRASRSRTGWLNRKTAGWGGAVAAAAAAVVFIVNMNGELPKQTAMLESTGTKASVYSATEETDQNAGAADPAASDRMMTDSSGGSDPAGSPKAVTDPSRKIANESQGNSSSSPPSASVGGLEGSTDYKTDPQGEGSANKTAPSQGIAAFPQQPGSPSPQGTGNFNGSSSTVDKSVSPDGKYIYAVDGSTLQVFAGDAKKLDFTIDGTLAQTPEWSSDSSVLTVKVKDAGGSVKTFKVNAAEGTIDEQKS